MRTISVKCEACGHTVPAYAGQQLWHQMCPQRKPRGNVPAYREVKP